MPTFCAQGIGSGPFFMKSTVSATGALSQLGASRPFSTAKPFSLYLVPGRKPKRARYIPSPSLMPPPESLRSDLDAYRALAKEMPEIERFAFRFEAIDSRQVERVLMTDTAKHPPFKHTWLKTRDPLPDDPEVHIALLAYMSDLDFMSTSMLPHGRNTIRQSIRGASLDHSIWFHRPFRADEWLLFAKESPNANGARGFVRGHFFNRDGDLVATAAQEALIRPIGEIREQLLAGKIS